MKDLLEWTKKMSGTQIFLINLIKGHAFVCCARKGEPLIFPVMSEIKSHCKVLGREKKRQVKASRTMVQDDQLIPLILD